MNLFLQLFTCKMAHGEETHLRRRRRRPQIGERKRTSNKENRENETYHRRVRQEGFGSYRTMNVTFDEFVDRFGSFDSDEEAYAVHRRVAELRQEAARRRSRTKRSESSHEPVCSKRGTAEEGGLSYFYFLQSPGDSILTEVSLN